MLLNLLGGPRAQKKLTVPFVLIHPISICHLQLITVHHDPLVSKDLPEVCDIDVFELGKSSILDNSTVPWRTSISSYVEKACMSWIRLWHNVGCSWK